MENFVALAMGAGGAVLGALIQKIFQFFNRQPETEASDDLKSRQQKTEAEIMKLRNELDNLKREAALDALKKKKQRLQELVKEREAKIQKLGIDNVNKFNYAVTGQAGVGKSSLVNAFLGLEKGDEGAAKVDQVECTSVLKPFSHPNIPRLIIWDLPGAGTIDHPISTYYEDKALYAFDAVFIVTGDRILDIDFQIAKQTQEANKPVVFVRSKADLHVKDLAHENDITMTEAAAEFRNKVKKNFLHEMLKAGLKDIDILIVSSRLFFSKTPAYTGIECMDEKLAMEFLLKTGAARFPHLTGMQEAMKNMRLQKRKRRAFCSSANPKRLM